jgi:amino acid adenylation domain-containing protein
MSEEQRHTNAAVEEEELIAFLLEQQQADRASNYAIVPRAEGDRIPLSYGQQRLWFLDQMEPGNPAYHLSLRQWFSGSLDCAVLESALNEVVRRHDVLRTTFGFEGGEAVQRVADQASVPLQAIDATGIESTRELEARLKELFRQPFDLESGRLLRAYLLQPAADKNLLFVVVHHIAGDRLSMIEFARELQVLYRAFAAGEESPLPPLPVQYADYAAWERSRQRETVHQRDLEYWKHKLANLGTLELPTDYSRPPIPGYEGAQLVDLLTPETAQAIDALAHRFGATRFMVMVAGLSILMHRLSGQQDVALGTPISNRNLPELENLIGYFTNTLVLRVDLAEDPTVADVVERTRETALGAFAHQDIPFERLVDEIKPDRDLSRHPLFQVLIVQLGGSSQSGNETAGNPGTPETGEGSGQDSGLLIHSPVFAEPEKTAVDYDLEIYISEHVQGLLVAWCFKTELFAADSMRGMLRQYGRLLRAMTENPDGRVAELYMLDEEERRLALSLRGSDRKETVFEPVHRLIERAVTTNPQAPAVIASDGELTYAELERRSNQLAHELRARGLGAEDLVGICLHRGCDLMVSLLAVFKAGCAYVPLDPMFPAARLGFMAGDAALELVLATQATSDAVAADVPWLLLDIEAERLAQQPSAPPEIDMAADRLAYVIYTSGSTGRPKGVRIEHGALSNFVQGLAEQVEFGPEDRLVSVASLSFDASVLDFYVPLVTGAAVILADRDTARDGVALAKLIETCKARAMHATPATWQMLLSSGWQGSPELRALSGGEALPGPLADRILNLCKELWNLYGPTETTVYSSVSNLGRPGRRDFVDIGSPIRNTRIYVLDPALQPVPPGVVGELCIGGAGVARDYLHRPELSAERFVADPFDTETGARLYRTGDLARMHHDGSVECLGRSDHQIKLRGYRIELGEIEAALADLRAVSQAVVMCREDVAGDPRLVAYLVMESSEILDPDELRANLRTRLPGYMIPSALIALEEMPLTPSAKIDRLALPAPSTTVRPRDDRFRPPSSPLELSLAEVWRQLLDIDEVGLDENFFDLGGHSLLAVKAIFEMKDRTGITISPAEYMMQNLGQIAAKYDHAPEAGKRRPRGLFDRIRRTSE